MVSGNREEGILGCCRLVAKNAARWFVSTKKMAREIYEGCISIE